MGLAVLKGIWYIASSVCVEPTMEDYKDGVTAAEPYPDTI